MTPPRGALDDDHGVAEYVHRTRLHCGGSVVADDAALVFFGDAADR